LYSTEQASADVGFAAAASCAIETAGTNAAALKAKPSARRGLLPIRDINFSLRRCVETRLQNGAATRRAGSNGVFLQHTIYSEDAVQGPPIVA
jgi:hypothetical protein